jgi:hypothetical protein
MARIVATTDLLTATSIFTSQALEAGLADRITGLVFADQGGTLFVEQSGDLNNWDLSTAHAVTANTGLGFSDEILAPYVRLRYVNGATNQGVFRLHSRMTSAGPR